MSIIDSCTCSLPKAENTVSCGRSLAQALYDFPVTILLSGELGAGKTTFLQGFAAGLNVGTVPTSPTFALEQRYETARHGELVHVDLYRLNARQARELVSSTEDHPGIRCIEWPERLETDLERAYPHAITMALREEGTGRSLTASFCDLPLPSPHDIDGWRADVLLPPHIVDHCRAVSRFCDTLAETFIRRGSLVRSGALHTAAELHDLLRFLDFRPGGHPTNGAANEDQRRAWAHWASLYPAVRHEQACAAFLRERGYRALGDIVEVHGLTLPSPIRATIEQRLLFYADKRILVDRVVSLEERFDDFRQRYGRGKETERSLAWYREAKDVEEKLFPEGVPG